MHACGAPCALTGKLGCQDQCTKPVAHEDKEHRCGTYAHRCGEVSFLVSIRASLLTKGRLIQPNNLSPAIYATPFFTLDNHSLAEAPVSSPCKCRFPRSRRIGWCQDSTPLTLLYFSDEPHNRHRCEEARECPIQCQLCPRLCANRDHFHGLDRNSPHLCGSALCFKCPLDTV